MEEKSSKQNPSTHHTPLPPAPVSPESGDGKVCFWQTSLLLAGGNILCDEQANQVWMKYDGLFVRLFFLIPTVFVCLWLRWGFFSPNPFCFLPLVWVLLETQGRGSQTLRTSRRRQIRMAFQHLRSSFELEKTLYSRRATPAAYFNFFNSCLALPFKVHWEDELSCLLKRYNKASFPIYLKQRHLEMRAMVQGGLVTLFPWQGSAY